MRSHTHRLPQPCRAFGLSSRMADPGGIVGYKKCLSNHVPMCSVPPPVPATLTMPKSHSPSFLLPLPPLGPGRVCKDRFSEVTNHLPAGALGQPEAGFSNCGQAVGAPSRASYGQQQQHPSKVLPQLSFLGLQVVGGDPTSLNVTSSSSCSLGVRPPLGRLDKSLRWGKRSEGGSREGQLIGKD